MVNRISQLSLVLVALLIAGCDSTIPNLDMQCSRENQSIAFKTDMEANALIGSDGSSTAFYDDNLVEIVFANFDEEGRPTRIVNFYPSDPGVEIIENNVSKSWLCVVQNF